MRFKTKQKGTSQKKVSSKKTLKIVKLSAFIEEDGKKINESRAEILKSWLQLSTFNIIFSKTSSSRTNSVKEGSSWHLTQKHRERERYARIKLMEYRNNNCFKESQAKICNC